MASRASGARFRPSLTSSPSASTPIPTAATPARTRLRYAASYPGFSTRTRSPTSVSASVAIRTPACAPGAMTIWCALQTTPRAQILCQGLAQRQKALRIAVERSGVGRRRQKRPSRRPPTPGERIQRRQTGRERPCRTRHRHGIYPLSDDAPVPIFGVRCRTWDDGIDERFARQSVPLHDAPAPRRASRKPFCDKLLISTGDGNPRQAEFLRQHARAGSGIPGCKVPSATPCEKTVPVAHARTAGHQATAESDSRSDKRWYASSCGTPVKWSLIFR